MDAILVYTFARAFRNHKQELTVRALRKHKVELISFAEPLTNDASGDLFRKFIGIFNEFQSAETSGRPLPPSMPILTRETYTGVRRFNEFNRKGDGKRKDASEIVEYDVPAIIDRASFDEVQALLVARQPRASA